MWDGIKRALPVTGSIAAMIVVALATCFLVAYPSLISFAGFFAAGPVFLIIGLGFFTIAPKGGRQLKRPYSEDIAGIPALLHRLLNTNCCKQVQEDIIKPKIKTPH